MVKVSDSLLAVLSLCISHSTATILKNEEFYENLKLTSLPDGRLSARFEFKTLLRDAIPRAPHTLAGEDERMHRSSISVRRRTPPKCAPKFDFK